MVELSQATCLLSHRDHLTPPAMPGLAATDNSLPAAAAPPLVAAAAEGAAGAVPVHLLARQAQEARPGRGRRLARQPGSGALPPQAGARRHGLRGGRRGEGSELELAMSLHVAATIHCGLGRHADAIPVIERAVAVVTPPPPAEADGEAADENHHQQQPQPEADQRGEKWSLAAFSGWMQLGDTHAMLGRMDDSIACYGKGLEIQMAALGDRDLPASAA
ncbi:uncharacterized protein LOC120707856 isoform X2 [Panicum virgatum]|uniref:uncharacterized protein LOC120707856 isoform X2 n=1 Tax=Panicum virgatum TaxID=38727 RepID=UPI0019D55AFC|nr:uncharacterized protein LOC120707856 isoform X2 [Panicum virgatum]